jgi:hypothetical protein
MAADNGPNVDLEPPEAYAAQPADGPLGLEPTDDYVKRLKADVHRDKAKAANRVALILVLALVLYFPIYVLVIAFAPSEPTATHLERVFLKSYDVLSPLVGMVIGALFGLSLSDRGRESRP